MPINDPVDLLDRTYRPREAVEYGRDWLLDCFSDDDDRDQILDLNAVAIVAAVDLHYDGGWQGFAAAESLWSGLTPREREEQRTDARLLQRAADDIAALSV